MKTKAFYTLAGLFLLLAFWNATWKTLRGFGDDPNPEHYLYMAPADRLTEIDKLSEETKNVGDIVTADRYFEVLARFEHLMDAMRRARLEEREFSVNGVMVNSRSSDDLNLGFIENQYVNIAQKRMAGHTSDEEIMKSKKKAGIDDIIKGHFAPMDPLTPKAWVFVYFAGMFLTFGRFVISINKMGGAWWMSALSDWRFPFWLLLWPKGIFFYPRKVDVLLQLRRAYRFAVFVLSSSLSLAAVGCAGKRVKTNPEEQRQDATHTLRLDISTTTWPKYLGGNGTVFHPEPVQQTAITLSLPKGFYLGMWDSMPLKQYDLSPNFGYEIDFSGGWNGQAHSIKLSTDVTHIGITPLARYRGDVLQLTAGASRDLKLKNGQTFSPYFSFVEYLPSAGSSPKGGLFYHEGLRWSWSRGKWSFGSSAELMHDPGAFGFNPGYFARGNASLGRKLNSHLRFEVPLMWSAPLLELGDGRRPEIQTGLTVAVH